jgi:hypothetical protein
MSLHSDSNEGGVMPAIAVIVAIVFVVVLFFKFVDWVGPLSGGGASEAGKAQGSVR